MFFHKATNTESTNPSMHFYQILTPSMHKMWPLNMHISVSVQLGMKTKKTLTHINSIYI